jgi:hypothetical protein
VTPKQVAQAVAKAGRHRVTPVTENEKRSAFLTDGPSRHIKLRGHELVMHHVVRRLGWKNCDLCQQLLATTLEIGVVALARFILAKTSYPLPGVVRLVSLADLG